MTASPAATGTPAPSPTPTGGSSAKPDPDADDVDLETGKAGTGGCKDDFYELLRTGNGVERLYGKLSWKFVKGTYPSYFTDNDKKAAIERFKDGGQHMARAYTTCRGDWAKGDPVPNGIGFVEDGTTDNPADFDTYDVPGDGDKKEELRCGEARKEGTKKQYVTHDGISQIEFGPVPAAAATCNWDEHTPSGPEKIVESDLRFRPNPFGSGFPSGEWFTAHDVPSGCQNKADLEGVTTHERGHSMGLDDVYDNGNGHPGLTMGATNDNCSRASRSLGKGDFLGLKDLYAR